MGLDGRNPEPPEANKNGYFVGPTIFADVTPCMKIVQKEIFRPVLSVMKTQDMDDTLDLIRKWATVLVCLPKTKCQQSGWHHHQALSAEKSVDRDQKSGSLM